MPQRAIRFTATIYKLGINPVVDPPRATLDKLFERAGRSKGPIPVRGTLNGAEFIQTLVKYSGQWRLYINAEMLKDSGAKIGNEVTIEIDFDPRPRDVQMPGALADAFREDLAAKAAFDRLTPSRRKEILRYLRSLKSPESIEKNVIRIVAQLRDEGVDPRHGEK